MGNLFNKQKKSRVTEQDKAVLQLKLQRDKLEQFKTKMTVEMEHLKGLAKQLLASKNKDKAKLLLRKKKFQETTLERTTAQLNNIEQMVSNIEFAQVEQDVMKNLQIGNEALKRLNKMMTLSDVEKILDENEEAIRYQKEIGDLIAGNLTNEDEDEVEAELAKILKDAETADIRLPEVPMETASTLPTATSNHYKLPDVPTHPVAETETVKKEALLAS